MWILREPLLRLPNGFLLFSSSTAIPSDQSDDNDDCGDIHAAVTVGGRHRPRSMERDNEVNIGIHSWIGASSIFHYGRRRKGLYSVPITQQISGLKLKEFHICIVTKEDKIAMKCLIKHLIFGVVK